MQREHVDEFPDKLHRLEVTTGIEHRTPPRKPGGILDRELGQIPFHPMTGPLIVNGGRKKLEQGLDAVKNASIGRCGKLDRIGPNCQPITFPPEMRIIGINGETNCR